jgi:hypothetical protein
MADSDKLTPETQRVLLQLLARVRRETVHLNAVILKLESAARANRGNGEIIRELKIFRDWFLSLAAAYSRMGLSMYSFFAEWKAVPQSYRFSEVMPWVLRVPWERG